MTTFGKLFIVGAIVVGIVGIGIFLYVTRPIASPTAENSLSPSPTPSGSPTSSPVADNTFRISAEESKAQFEIKEVLNGKPKTAIGTTNQLSGDIILNTDDISQSQIETIKINARTLKTDEERRDNVITRFILKSEDSVNEFITYKPTAIKVLSGDIGKGTVTFDMKGDLTIAGTTRETVFHGTVTLSKGEKLTTIVSATIKRADFGLTVPSVPFVASVNEQVVLKATIVANKLQ